MNRTPEPTASGEQWSPLARVIACSIVQTTLQRSIVGEATRRDLVGALRIAQVLGAEAVEMLRNEFPDEDDGCQA